MHGWDLDTYAARAQAFGWEALIVDGHDVAAIDAATRQARQSERPCAIVARTVKGRGVKEVENLPGKHGKPLEDPRRAIEELGGEHEIRVEVAKPTGDYEPPRFRVPGGELPAVRESAIRSRRARHTARRSRHWATCAATWLHSTARSQTRPTARSSADAHPERYFEMFIAEQQMIAAAVGIQRRGWVPFASTFAAFLTRAYDFVRMAAVSHANLRLCGSHAGVAIGEDGPSQMGLEDLASFSTTQLERGAVSLRREPDRELGGRDGRPRWHHLPAHATGR